MKISILNRRASGFSLFCVLSCSSVVEPCQPSLTNRPLRQSPDTESSTGFPKSLLTHPSWDLHAALSIYASHTWHSQISSTVLFFNLKPTTILKVKGILPFFKGTSRSTATTFKKTHIFIWISPFMKARPFASTLLLSKVFHVCMRLTSYETSLKSMLYLLASVHNVSTLSSHNRLTGHCGFCRIGLSDFRDILPTN